MCFLAMVFLNLINLPKLDSFSSLLVVTWPTDLHFVCSLGKAIGGYSHFGSCSGPAAQRDVIREPTAGEKMIEKFRTTNPGKSLRIQTCPRCHQKNLKESNNNHLKCWACKTDFCYQCGKAIKGLMTSHFVASSPCTQHSE